MACQPLPIRSWDRDDNDDWRIHRRSYREWFPAEAPPGRAILVQLRRDPIEASLDQAEALRAPVDDDDAAAPASDVALDRARQFIRACSDAAKRLGQHLAVPVISLGPESSVDLFWRVGAAFEILVNFPSDARAPATFYGDDRGVQQIRGTITGEDALLLPWLTTRR